MWCLLTHWTLTIEYWCVLVEVSGKARETYVFLIDLTSWYWVLLLLVWFVHLYLLYKYFVVFVTFISFADYLIFFIFLFFCNISSLFKQQIDCFPSPKSVMLQTFALSWFLLCIAADLAPVYLWGHFLSLTDFFNVPADVPVCVCGHFVRLCVCCWSPVPGLSALFLRILVVTLCTCEWVLCLRLMVIHWNSFFCVSLGHFLSGNVTFCSLLVVSLYIWSSLTFRATLVFKTLSQTCCNDAVLLHVIMWPAVNHLLQ